MIPAANAATVCNTSRRLGRSTSVWRWRFVTNSASEAPSSPMSRISPASQAWKSSLSSCRTFTLSADPGLPIRVERPMAERILLVDDHPLTRSALSGLLTHHGFDVIGEAADGEEAIARAADLLPDLVLLHLSMSG